MNLIPSSTLGLTSDIAPILAKLIEVASNNYWNDEKLYRYLRGQNRLNWMGISVPPQMYQFQLVVGWPQMTVEVVSERSDIKSLLMADGVSQDTATTEIFNYNNMHSEVALHVRDKLTYGRAFFSVGANEEDPDMPLVRAESPREISVLVDARTRRLVAGLRLTRGLGQEVTAATVYLPDATYWLEQQQGRWRIVNRDDHRLGVVPLIMTLNRRMTGEWRGQSEMASVIPVTDACMRTLTNMQVGIEALGTPQRYALGMTKADFVDKQGNPLPTWEAYFGQVWTSANPDAKLGQFDAADMKNYHETVRLYGQLGASATGYPPEYFGITSVNPPGEGGIRAREARVVKRTERSNAETGVGLGWALGLAHRFRSKEWPEGRRVIPEWHDPGTPTVAQRADAIQKLAGGTRILSREGAWDELGWSDERKARERDYLRKEQEELYMLSDSDADLDPERVDEQRGA